MVAAKKLQVDIQSLQEKTESEKARPAKLTRSGSKTGRRDLTLDMIKSDSMGAPVARYIFPYIKKQGVFNKELTEALGYSHHSNMSMVRSGAAKLPIVKAAKMAEILELPNPYEFGLLVAENNMPEEVNVLLELGVIVTQEERDILDLIQSKVPAGDMGDFKFKLQALLDEY